MVSEDPADTFIRYEADGRTIELPIARRQTCTIGRAATNTIVLDDDTASREHASIRRSAAGLCTLKDLGSTNGTLLNGRMIGGGAGLTSGDRIQVGRHNFDFVQVGEASPDEKKKFVVEQQLVSALVLDLRGYSSLALQIGLTRTVEMLDTISHTTGELLTEAQCWSTKYIGSTIVALWVHSKVELRRPDVTRVFDVVGGYHKILQAAEEQFATPTPLRFGCGYSAGLAAIGDIGTADAADLTAMGDAVNSAFWLETATQEAGCDVLIARAVFELLRDSRTMPDKLTPVKVPDQKKPLQALALKLPEMPGFLRGLFS